MKKSFICSENIFDNISIKNDILIPLDYSWIICFFIALLNIVLQDSASVAKAKERHNELYHKIAEQHAAIAAQREAERRAYGATSVANDVNDHSTY